MIIPCYRCKGKVAPRASRLFKIMQPAVAELGTQPRLLTTRPGLMVEASVTSTVPETQGFEMKRCVPGVRGPGNTGQPGVPPKAKPVCGGSYFHSPSLPSTSPVPPPPPHNHFSACPAKT